MLKNQVVNHIHFSNRRNNRTTGVLDVDMNVRAETRNAVENITWSCLDRMLEGRYHVFIHNYTPRETIDVGFTVEIEYNGVIHTVHYEKRVRGNVTVAEFDFSRKDGIKFISSLPFTQATKEVWGLNTQNYHKVLMVMNSPNHWDGNETGNKHHFFILEDCINDKKARGFFNEFLKEDLREHRKVFEVLGSKLRVEESDNQLSGLGFSSTQRNDIMCKVSGSFSRIIKINF